MSKKYIYLLLTLMYTGLHAQTTNDNYVHTRVFQNNTGTSSLNEIQYFDGLGRPIEKIMRNFAPGNRDLVYLLEYNRAGYLTNEWLPASIASNGGAFVQPSVVKVQSRQSNQNDTYSYTQYSYEISPLERLTSVYGPGSSWRSASKSTTFTYASNIIGGAGMVIRFVSGTDPTTVSITRNSYYDPNDLYLITNKDEDGNTYEEFTDKAGRLLLSRKMVAGQQVNTYYVYDNYNNLRAVFPPSLIDKLPTSGVITDSNTDVQQLAFLYKYDTKNRCIASKLPGCDWTYYVYDKADQLIFTQDGELRQKSQWKFGIPDINGQTLLTGTCTNSLNYATDPLKNVVVTGSWANVANSSYGYTVTGITLSSPVYLMAFYYDQYDFMGKNDIPNYAYDSSKEAEGYGKRYAGSNGYEAKGMLTGLVKAELGTAAPTYLYSVYYYDKRKQVVQSHSSTQLSGGVNREFISYNFIGQPLKLMTLQEATGKTTLTEYYAYTYDMANRPVKITHQYKEGTAAVKPLVTLAEYTYDELGRPLTEKKNGLANLTTTYAYNVRSDLKSISGTLYNQTLYYQDSYAGNTPAYNGNISAIQWTTSGDKNRGYRYTYDGLSRLTAANYLENGAANNSYEVTYSYDKQGNVTTLQRYGKTTASAYGIIDNLGLTYEGNQLLRVTEAAANITLAESNDFKKYSTATREYEYNKNGALTKDLNKGLSQIQYNSLELPVLIDIKNPAGEARNEYLYAADGQKLRVTKRWNSNYSTSPVIGSAVNVSALNMTSTTDYVDNKIYEDGSLKRILVEGGYIEGGIYYFYITDHLGNNRVIANQSGTVIQRNHYYPYGTPFAETSQADQEKQTYKYNDKEFDRTRGLNLYDYSARLMEPALGRFTTVDPLTENYYSQSPYAYVNNNPVRFIDPDGTSTHTDSLGNVVAVYNDGDLGVYQHDISAETYDGSRLSGKNGTKMGETWFWDEFIIPDGSESVFGVIEFGFRFDQAIENFHNRTWNMNLIEIAQQSKAGKMLDIKKYFPNKGGLFKGKYISSRTAGNFLAGYNAATSTLFGVSISFETFQQLAGALHIEENQGRKLSKAQMADIVLFGFYSGVDKNKFRAPYWGEVEYQYRASKWGWDYGKSKK